MRIISIQSVIAEHIKKQAQEQMQTSKTLPRKDKVRHLLDAQNRSKNHVPEYKGDKNQIYRVLVEEIIQKMYFYAKRDHYDLNEQMPTNWEEFILDYRRMPAGVLVFMDTLDVFDKTKIVLSALKARHDNFVWLDAKNYAERKHRIRYAPFELLPVELMCQAYESSKEVFAEFDLKVEERLLIDEFVKQKDAWLDAHGIKDQLSLMRYFNEQLREDYPPAKAYAGLLENKADAMAFASEVSYYDGY